MKVKTGELLEGKSYSGEFKKLYACAHSDLEFSTGGYSGYSDGRFISLDEMPNYDMHPADYELAQLVAKRKVLTPDNNRKIS